MQDRSRRRQLAIAIVLIWVLSGVLAIVGRDNRAVPTWLTVVAAVVFIGALALVIPTSLIYGLIREPGVARGSLSWMAVSMAPLMGLSGVVSVAIGLLLLVPVGHPPLAVRLGGVAYTVFGTGAIWITVMAIRKKRRMSRMGTPLP